MGAIPDIPCSLEPNVPSSLAVAAGSGLTDDIIPPSMLSLEIVPSASEQYLVPSAMAADENALALPDAAPVLSTSQSRPEYAAYPPDPPPPDPREEARGARRRQIASRKYATYQKEEASQELLALQEEQKNAAEARSRPRYVREASPEQVAPAVSPTTQQIMDNADAAAASMYQDVAEGRQVLDSIMGGETAHKKRSKEASVDTDSSMQLSLRKNEDSSYQAPAKKRGATRKRG